jgi:hypothetical protein
MENLELYWLLHPTMARLKHLESKVRHDLMLGQEADVTFVTGTKELTEDFHLLSLFKTTDETVELSTVVQPPVLIRLDAYDANGEPFWVRIKRSLPASVDFAGREVLLKISRKKAASLKVDDLKQMLLGVCDETSPSLTFSGDVMKGSSQIKEFLPLDESTEVKLGFVWEPPPGPLMYYYCYVMTPIAPPMPTDALAAAPPVPMGAAPVAPPVPMGVPPVVPPMPIGVPGQAVAAAGVPGIPFHVPLARQGPAGQPLPRNIVAPPAPGAAAAGGNETAQPREEERAAVASASPAELQAILQQRLRQSLYHR